MNPTRLAIIATHPIQYYAPWFRYLHQCVRLDVKVFYLWKPEDKTDPGFDQKVEWDVPLLNGYEHEFVENVSDQKGTESYRGLINPTLKHQIEQYSPDVVLCTAYRYHSISQFINSWKRKTPILFRGDSHRLVKETGIKAQLRKSAIRFLFRHFDAALYVGKANQQYFLEHGFDENQLAFTPHAVDNEWFTQQCGAANEDSKKLRLTIGASEESKVILFVGKLIQKKNPDQLIEAFVNLNKTDAHLVLCGSGSMEAELRKLAADHANIHFLGFQNQSQMPAVYGMADLIVLPSSGKSETWGLCINEAMACGVPALVSDQVGCHLDLIIDDKTGRVFKANDVDHLTSQLKHLLSDKLDLSLLGETARSHIQNYSYEKATKGLLEMIDKLLTKQNGHRS